MLFGPESDGPKLFVGVAQFACEAVADEPGINAGAGSIIHPAGFLILQKKTQGGEVRVPAEQTEGFEGGVFTLDGRLLDAQFGSTPEGAGEAGLDDRFVAALKNDKLLSTKINGAKPVNWPLTGSAAVVTKIEECLSRQGLLP